MAITALWLPALTAPHIAAAAAAPDSVSANPGVAGMRTGWLGNTFRGGGHKNGRWVHLNLDDIFVFPDGRAAADRTALMQTALYGNGIDLLGYNAYGTIGSQEPSRDGLG